MRITRQICASSPKIYVQAISIQQASTSLLTTPRTSLWWTDCQSLDIAHPVPLVWTECIPELDALLCQRLHQTCLRPLAPQTPPRNAYVWANSKPVGLEMDHWTTAYRQPLQTGMLLHCNSCLPRSIPTHSSNLLYVSPPGKTPPILEC